MAVSPYWPRNCAIGVAPQTQLPPQLSEHSQILYNVRTQPSNVFSCLLSPKDSLIYRLESAAEEERRGIQPLISMAIASSLTMYELEPPFLPLYVHFLLAFRTLHGVQLLSLNAQSHLNRIRQQAPISYFYSRIGSERPCHTFFAYPRWSPRLLGQRILHLMSHTLAPLQRADMCFIVIFQSLPHEVVVNHTFFFLSFVHTHTHTYTHTHTHTCLREETG